MGLVQRALRYEIGMYVSLGRWLARRPSVPAGAEPVGYARTATPVIWLWIFGSAAEIPVAHLLVPWEPVRTALLVVGVWGLLWMLGMLASLHVHPHLLTAEALRVRNGARIDLRVPWDAVAQVETRRRDHPSSARSLQDTEDGGLAVAVGGETNLRLVLHRP